MSGATTLLFSVLVILSQQKDPLEPVQKKSNMTNSSSLFVGSPYSIITPKGTFIVDPGTKVMEIRVAVGRMVNGKFVRYQGYPAVLGTCAEIGPGKFNFAAFDVTMDPDWKVVVVRAELWTSDKNSPQLTRRDVSYKTLP